MRRVLAAGALVIMVLGPAVLGTATPADAGAAAGAALGLASFAVFNELVGIFAHPGYVYREVIYQPIDAPPPVVYAPPRVADASAPPAPPQP